VKNFTTFMLGMGVIALVGGMLYQDSEVQALHRRVHILEMDREAHERALASRSHMDWVYGCDPIRAYPAKCPDSDYFDSGLNKSPRDIPSKDQ
jgi:hypothetical protein